MNSFLFDAINELAGHWSAFDRLAEDVARYGAFLLILMAASFWFVGRSGGERAVNRTMVLSAAVAGALSLFLAQAIGHFYYHPRPFAERGDVVQLLGHATDSSFPSEHAAGAFAVAGSLFWLRRGWGLVALGLAALVGLARIYAGIHYPADILAGAAIGLAVSYLVGLGGPLIAQVEVLTRRFMPRLLR
jgi:undecaprenyl-diphosphatase